MTEVPVRISAAVFAVLAICFALPAAAKGRTVKIVFQGAAPAQPIEIKDSQVAEFNIWSGPGVNHGEQTEGFIIDWMDGPVAEPPASLPQYEVSFYALEIGLSYQARYAPDPSGRGFVYLPRSDLNVSHIYRGPKYEGHWFRATPAWDKFAKKFLPEE